MDQTRIVGAKESFGHNDDKKVGLQPNDIHSKYCTSRAWIFYVPGARLTLNFII